MKRKMGFTLAEVLMTLLVIGIVAAITIPMLLNAMEKKDDIVLFKKNLSTLAEALQQVAIRDNVCEKISNNEELAQCIHDVYIVGTIKDNVITLPDAVTYTFFWRKNNVGSFEDCGEDFGSTEEEWTGENANCVVVLDLNGANKGSSATDDYGRKEKIYEPSAPDEQYPLIIKKSGVRTPFYLNAKGYEYIYGQLPTTDSKKPWENLEETN